jgi:cell wall-associated NlpC family hydrolase
VSPWRALAVLVVVCFIGHLAAVAGHPQAAGGAGHRAGTVTSARLDVAQPGASAHARQAASAVSFARSKDGGPYLWGGNGPSAYDCSGLVTAAWGQAGVSIARTADSEWHSLRHVSTSRLQPGDLLFYAGKDGTWSDPGHVTMYDGHGQMTEAYSTAVGIRTTGVRWDGLIGAARP